MKLLKILIPAVILNKIYKKSGSNKTLTNQEKDAMEDLKDDAS